MTIATEYSSQRFDSITDDRSKLIRKIVQLFTAGLSIKTSLTLKPHHNALTHITSDDQQAFHCPLLAIISALHVQMTELMS